MIEKKFPIASEHFPTTNMGDLLTNPEEPDDEVREYARPFLGKNWQEITPRIWFKEDGFLYFATEKAFAYFLPSVLKGFYQQMLDRRNSIGNTVDAILFCLTAGFKSPKRFALALSERNNNYRINRIRNVLADYNTEQLDIIRLWAEDMDERLGDILVYEHQENMMIFLLTDYMKSKFKAG